MQSSHTRLQRESMEPAVPEHQRQFEEDQLPPDAHIHVK
jgi:hypothetical protein